MIFYFSGTGNTKWAVDELISVTKENCHDIANEINESNGESHQYEVKENESIGFAFPVHSWGPPKIVMDFILNLHLKGYNTTNYTYFLSTCGDDIGYTIEILSTQLKKVNTQLHAGYLLVMPNTYISFPGFDVDSNAVREQKLGDAKKNIKSIIENIQNKCSGYYFIRKGAFPWIKSKVIYPLFVKYGLSDTSFKVTDECIGCSLCASACPTGNVHFNNGRPSWHHNCTKCLACYHICPAHAIRCGSYSNKKGQYYAPKFISSNAD